MPVGVMIAEPPAEALAFANSRAGEILQLPFESLQERWQNRTLEAYDGEGRALGHDDWPLIRAAVHGETITAVKLSITGGNGRLVRLELSASPIRRDGRVVAGVVSFRDITEPHALQLRARVLTQAGQLFSRAAEAESALGAVAGILVPAFADWCSVDRVERDGTVAPLSVPASDAETGARFEVLRVTGRPSPEHPQARAIRTGRAQLVEVGSRTGSTGSLPWPDSVAKPAENVSWMVVPVRARDDVIATVSLCRSTLRGAFKAADVVLIEELAGRVAMAVDNTRLLERARGERDRLLQLLDRLEQGVLGIDATCRLAFANPAAFRILGEELQDGRPLPEPWSGFSFAKLLPTLFQQQELVHAEVRSPSGSYAIAGIPAGDRDLAMLVVTNVSERDRRRLAEREFVTNAAHELQTPLTAIIGAAEVLQSGAKETPTARDLFLGHIEREAGRLARLTRALLFLARVQTDQERTVRQPVDLRPLLEATGAGLWPTPRSEIAVECADDVSVESDPDLLEHVVASLAGNAARYASAGPIVLAAYPRGDTDVVIEVRDTGPGIAAGELDRIFEPFYRGSRRDGSGFGLGLSIVAQAVEALGGRIEIDTVVDRGTTMRVVLDRPGNG